MKTFFLLSMAALTAVGCGKSDKNDPAPRSTIAYQGTVNLVDEFGNSQGDRSLVSVVITDTNPNWVVRPDASGAYSIPLGNVPAGTHQLRYSLPGAGIYLQFNVATGATLPPVTIGRLTTTHITLVAAKAGSNYVIHGSTVERPTPTQLLPYRLFLTRSFAPSPSPPIATAYYLSLAGTPAVDGSFTVTLTPGDLTAAGFQMGDDILVYAAGDSPAASTYTDPTTNKTVYPADNLRVNPTPALFGFR